MSPDREPFVRHKRAEPRKNNKTRSRKLRMQKFLCVAGLAGGRAGKRRRRRGCPGANGELCFPPLSTSTRTMYTHNGTSTSGQVQVQKECSRVAGCGWCHVSDALVVHTTPADASTTTRCVTATTQKWVRRDRSSPLPFKRHASLICISGAWLNIRSLVAKYLQR